MRATQIKREAANQATGVPGEILVQWDDGHSSRYSLAYLREECPCAGCKGEVLFGKVYRPPTLSVFKPGMNELTQLKPTGGYGVMASWGDGHDTGIYSWEYLRMICPCAECVAKRPAPVE